MTTAVVIPAVMASPGRPTSVATSALAPISTAGAQAWNGRKIRSIRKSTKLTEVAATRETAAVVLWS